MEPTDETPTQPWPGPTAYTTAFVEAGLFHGRRNEIENLASLIRSYNFVLLHGDSGDGKSSLVTGTLPELDDCHIIGVARPDPWSQEMTDPSVNYYVQAVLDDLNHSSFQWSDLTTFLRRETMQRGDDGKARRAILILDQFERVLRRSGGNWRQHQRDFMAQLQAAVDASPNLRILCVVQDDQRSPVERLAQELESGFNARMHLDRFLPDAAKEALIEPAKQFDLHFDDEALTELLTQMQREKFFNIESTHERISPIVLAVAAGALWELHGAGSVLTADDIDEESVQGALIQHYERAISKLGLSQAEESELREFIQQELISEAEGELLLLRDQGQPEIEHLDVLRDAAIVRRTTHRSITYWEVTHRTFIRPILDSNQERRRKLRAEEEAQRERELVELAEREQANEAIRARRSNHMRIGMVVLAVLGALIGALVAARLDTEVVVGPGDDSNLWPVTFSADKGLERIVLPQNEAESLIVEARPARSELRLEIALIGPDDEEQPAVFRDDGPTYAHGYELEPGTRYELRIANRDQDQLDPVDSLENQVEVLYAFDESFLSDAEIRELYATTPSRFVETPVCAGSAEADEGELLGFANGTRTDRVGYAAATDVLFAQLARPDSECGDIAAVVPQLSEFSIPTSVPEVPDADVVSVTCSIDADGPVAVGTPLRVSAFVEPPVDDIELQFQDNVRSTFGAGREAVIDYSSAGKYAVSLVWRQGLTSGVAGCGVAVVVDVDVTCTVSLQATPQDRSKSITAAPSEIVMVHLAPTPPDLVFTGTLSHGDGTTVNASDRLAVYLEPGEYDMVLDWSAVTASGQATCGRITVE